MCVQAPRVPEQASTVQALPSLQFGAVPPWHTPGVESVLLQVSTPLQKSPSSQLDAVAAVHALPGVQPTMVQT